MENPDIQKEQADFMDACDARQFPIDQVIEGTKMPNDELELSDATVLCNNLIEEECIKELLPAIRELVDLIEHDGNQKEILDKLVEIYDGGIDTIYVIMQLFNTLDLPFAQGWEAVAKNNMTKAVKQADGSFKVIKREGDGKVLKPEGYQPVDLKSILEAHLAKRRAE